MQKCTFSDISSRCAEQQGDKDLSDLFGGLPASTTSGLTAEFEAMAGGNDKLMANNGYASDHARSEDMAKPIVFLNSDLASYVSGELMNVDFGGHIEEIAGIRPVVNDINLTKILEYMKAMSQKQ